MKNTDKYKQTKYKIKDGRINPSADKKNVQVSSWLITKLISKCYEENIPIYARGRLLDLGCGNVPLFDAYKPYIENNICVDWGNSVHKNSYLDVVTDLNMKLPFSDKTFETILFSDVLEHLENPKIMFEEMKRVLKPGGCILMNVPFHYWIHEEPYDYCRYTEYWYKKIAESLDLEIVIIKRIGGVMDVKKDIVSKIANMIVPNSIIVRWSQKIYYHVFRRNFFVKKLK